MIRIDPVGVGAVRAGHRLAGAVRAVYGIAGAAAGAVTALRAFAASGEDRVRLEERRGLWAGHGRSRAPWIWIHGASQGEAEIAVAVARALGLALARTSPGVQMLVSSMTATGRARVAREQGIESRYFPIDSARFLERILSSGLPRLFVTVETEIWPETLRLLQERGVPCAVVNARLSERSAPRYRRLRALFGPPLAGLARVCARDAEAAERWRAAGASEAAVEVTGNIKFDLASEPGGGASAEPLFQRVSESPILLAASTHDGEESLCAVAFERACQQLSTARRCSARLLVAPRHPERAAPVTAMLRSRGWQVACWSELEVGGAAAGWPTGARAVVLDRMGLLRRAYACAAAAFVGGSAAPGPGGHNLLEPVAAGCPLATGKHLENVADQAELLFETGALRIANDVEGLAKFWTEALLHADDFRAPLSEAQDAVRARRGALDRNVAALVSLLQSAPPGAAGTGTR